MHTRLLSSCNTVSVAKSVSRQILFSAVSPCASAPRRIPHHQEHATGSRTQTPRAEHSQPHTDTKGLAQISHHQKHVLPCRPVPMHRLHAAGPRMQHNKGLSEPASHAAAPPAGNKGLSNPASRASATSGAPAQTAHHMPQPSRKHSEARVPFQINPNRVCVRKRVGRGTVKTHSNCN